MFLYFCQSHNFPILSPRSAAVCLFFRHRDAFLPGCLSDRQRVTGLRHAVAHQFQKTHLYLREVSVLIVIHSLQRFFLQVIQLPFTPFFSGPLMYLYQLVSSIADTGSKSKGISVIDIAVIVFAVNAVPMEILLFFSRQKLSEGFPLKSLISWQSGSFAERGRQVRKLHKSPSSLPFRYGSRHADD